MVILSCTPPPGAQPFSQVSHRAVTAVQKETSSHAFQMPWHIQEGTGGKKTQPNKQHGHPGYSRALQIAPDIFTQATEADPCALQQTNQQCLDWSFRKSLESRRAMASRA